MNTNKLSSFKEIIKISENTEIISRKTKDKRLWNKKLNRNFETSKVKINDFLRWNI